MPALRGRAFPGFAPTASLGPCRVVGAEVASETGGALGHDCQEAGRLCSGLVLGRRRFGSPTARRGRPPCRFFGAAFASGARVMWDTRRVGWGGSDGVRWAMWSCSGRMARGSSRWRARRAAMSAGKAAIASVAGEERQREGVARGLVGGEGVRAAGGERLGKERGVAQGVGDAMGGDGILEVGRVADQRPAGAELWRKKPGSPAKPRGRSTRRPRASSSARARADFGGRGGGGPRARSAADLGAEARGRHGRRRRNAGRRRSGSPPRRGRGGSSSGCRGPRAPRRRRRRWRSRAGRPEAGRVHPARHGGAAAIGADHDRRPRVRSRRSGPIRVAPVTRPEGSRVRVGRGRCRSGARHPPQPRPRPAADRAGCAGGR